MSTATTTYLIKHPVRYNGHLHQRGQKIELPEKTAFDLLARGVITTGAGAPVVLQVIEGPSAAEQLTIINKLNGMTKSELIEYGLGSYKLTLNGDDKKEALVAAIYDAHLLTLTPAQA